MVQNQVCLWLVCMVGDQHSTSRGRITCRCSTYKLLVTRALGRARDLSWALPFKRKGGTPYTFSRSVDRLSRFHGIYRQISQILGPDRSGTYASFVWPSVYHIRVQHTPTTASSEARWRRQRPAQLAQGRSEMSKQMQHACLHGALAMIWLTNWPRHYSSKKVVVGCMMMSTVNVNGIMGHGVHIS